MTAQLLRDAAEAIRHDWGQDNGGRSPQDAFHLAVADWLDNEAEVMESVPSTWSEGARALMTSSPAVAVARAYLGRDA